jgi:hypothetical protein
MNTTSSRKRKPATGQCFVVRALNRKGHTHAGAIALARRRIARGGRGYSHTLLVVQVAAVVRLKQVSAITVEEVKQ